MRSLKTRNRFGLGSVLAAAALLLAFSAPATALIELGEVDDNDTTTLEKIDADSLRAGGFIWSDG